MADAVPIATAARELNTTTGTLRRWLREGCPCECPGDVGRGHGALVDLTAVRQWRARRSGVEYTGHEHVMRRVAVALLDTLMRDGGNGVPLHQRLGIPEAKAAAYLGIAFERIHRAVTGIDAATLPPEIERIRSICLLSR